MCVCVFGCAFVCTCSVIASLIVGERAEHCGDDDDDDEDCGLGHEEP